MLDGAGGESRKTEKERRARGGKDLGGMLGEREAGKPSARGEATGLRRAGFLGGSRSKGKGVDSIECISMLISSAVAGSRLCQSRRPTEGREARGGSKGSASRRGRLSQAECTSGWLRLAAGHWKAALELEYLCIQVPPQASPSASFRLSNSSLLLRPTS